MSLFDDPRPVLNPAIWLDENTIRPEVSEYIHDVLYQMFPAALVSRLVAPVFAENAPGAQPIKVEKSEESEDE